MQMMQAKGFPSQQMQLGAPQQMSVNHDRDLLRFYLTQSAFYHICHKKATIAFNMFSNVVALLIGACLITAGGIGLATLGNNESGLKVAIGVISLVGTFFLVLQRQFVPAVTGKLHEIAAKEYLSLFESVHDLKLTIDCGETIGKEQLTALKHRFDDIQGHSPPTDMFEGRISKPFWMNLVFCCCGLSQVSGPGSDNISELADYMGGGGEMPTMNMPMMPMSYAQPSAAPRGFQGPGSKIKTNPTFNNNRRNNDESVDYTSNDYEHAAAEFKASPSMAPSRAPKSRVGGDEDVRKSFASQPQTSPRPKSQRIPISSTPDV